MRTLTHRDIQVESVIPIADVQDLSCRGAAICSGRRYQPAGTITKFAMD